MQVDRQTDTHTDMLIMQTAQNLHIMCDSGPFPPLHENMMSSTKPEVSRGRQSYSHR